MTRAILFDLDGTLVDRATSVRTLVDAQWQTFAHELMRVPRLTYVDRFLALDAHGHRNKTVVYQEMTKAFGLPADLAAALTAHFWANYCAYARLFPDTLHVLQALHARGLKLGVITNGAVAVQEPVLAHLGLAPLLDVIIISEREGVRKPQPAIFARALTAVGVPPAEAWFVGDHPITDVAAAAAVGLTAVWRRNDCWVSPTGPYRTIDTIADVLGLLNEHPAPAA